MSVVQVIALFIYMSVLTAVVYAAPKPPVKPLPPAPEGVVIKENVPYLDAGREEKLDLYLPAGRPLNVKSPAVVMIHGGGWRGGDKAAPREFNLGTNLAKAGYVCVSVNYTLDPRESWPRNLWDCKNAVRFLRVNAWKYQVDSEHIGVIGGSAGGHLALMAGYTTDVPDLEPPTPYPGISSRVSAVVDLYGITNLLSSKETDEKGNPMARSKVSWALLKEPGMKGDLDACRKASPVYQAKKTSPPTLILHGTADTTVDRDQATELAAKLRELGVEHHVYLLQGIGHTFVFDAWKGKPLPIDVKSIVIGFFDRHLKAAQD